MIPETHRTLPASIIPYNSAYLSVYVMFPGAALDSLYLHFDANGRPRCSAGHEMPEWLSAHFEWFARDDRVSLFINGDTDILIANEWSEEDLAKFRGKSWSVYMYEPLFFRNAQGLYPYVPGKDEEPIVCFELDWLQSFIDRVGDVGDVVVFTCDYDVQKAKLKRSERYQFRFETLDTFLMSTACQLFSECQSNLVRRPGPITKKAICLNFRWEAVRELTVAFLRSRPYFSDCIVSFYHRHDREQFLEKLSFDPFQWDIGNELETALVAIQKELPFAHNVSNPQVADPRQQALPNIMGYENNIVVDSRHYSLYEQSFLSIVTESRIVSEFGCISEKTLRPILLRRPFVLIGGPRLLEYMRELGFKTFSDFWDESYDAIENHEERIKAVYALIDKILSRPLHELKELYLAMEEVLRHNQRHLMTGLIGRLYDKKVEAQRQAKVVELVNGARLPKGC